MTTSNPRPVAKFPSNVWGDRFTSFSLANSAFDSCDKQVEELKEKVMKMLLGSKSNPIEKIILIDSLCRLGVSYHFEPEIENLVKHIYSDYVQTNNCSSYDLHITALVFRVLMLHGYRVFCEIFNKFKNCDGKFKESITRDVKGMLSLYQATHLRVHREDILDEALVFTTTHLKSIANDHPLEKHVIYALEHPIHKGMPRLEARRYISLYQEDESCNETLLKFAKLDFNRVQLLHEHEIGRLSRRWKELKFAESLSYARQRIVEQYFWMLVLFFEPQYSRARIIVTKIFAMISILDDTYDAYATFEELQRLTDAIQKWDASVVDQLPDYMKIIFNTLLKLYEEIENEMSKEGRAYSANYSKEAVKELIMFYSIEAKWLNEEHVPSFNKYMENALTSSGVKLIALSSLVGMGEVAGKDAFEWMVSNPKSIKSLEAIARLLNDMFGHQAEQERKHIDSAVEVYMKEYGVSEEDAWEKFRGMIENTWKDLNKECLSPTAVPMKLMMRVLNFTRSMEVIYKYCDGYTNPTIYVKEHITSLFVDPIPILE